MNLFGCAQEASNSEFGLVWGREKKRTQTGDHRFALVRIHVGENLRKRSSVQLPNQMEQRQCLHINTAC